MSVDIFSNPETFHLHILASRFAEATFERPGTDEKGVLNILQEVVKSGKENEFEGMLSDYIDTFGDPSFKDKVRNENSEPDLVAAIIKNEMGITDFTYEERALSLWNTGQQKLDRNILTYGFQGMLDSVANIGDVFIDNPKAALIGTGALAAIFGTAAIWGFGAKAAEYAGKFMVIEGGIRLGGNVILATFLADNREEEVERAIEGGNGATDLIAGLVTIWGAAKSMAATNAVSLANELANKKVASQKSIIGIIAHAEKNGSSPVNALDATIDKLSKIWGNGAAVVVFLRFELYDSMYTSPRYDGLCYSILKKLGYFETDNGINHLKTIISSKRWYSRFKDVWSGARWRDKWETDISFESISPIWEDAVRTLASRENPKSVIAFLKRVEERMYKTASSLRTGKDVKITANLLPSEIEEIERHSANSKFLQLLENLKRELYWPESVDDIKKTPTSMLEEFISYCWYLPEGADPKMFFAKMSSIFEEGVRTLIAQSKDPNELQSIRYDLYDVNHNMYVFMANEKKAGNLDKVESTTDFFKLLKKLREEFFGPDI